MIGFQSGSVGFLPVRAWFSQGFAGFRLWVLDLLMILLVGSSRSERYARGFQQVRA
jgi:hypothetical protein